MKELDSSATETLGYAPESLAIVKNASLEIKKIQDDIEQKKEFILSDTFYPLIAKLMHIGVSKDQIDIDISNDLSNPKILNNQEYQTLLSAIQKYTHNPNLTLTSPEFINFLQESSVLVNAYRQQEVAKLADGQSFLTPTGIEYSKTDIVSTQYFDMSGSLDFLRPDDITKLDTCVTAWRLWLDIAKQKAVKWYNTGMESKMDRHRALDTATKTIEKILDSHSDQTPITQTEIDTIFTCMMGIEQEGSIIGTEKIIKRRNFVNKREQFRPEVFSGVLWSQLRTAGFVDSIKEYTNFQGSTTGNSIFHDMRNDALIPILESKQTPGSPTVDDILRHEGLKNALMDGSSPLHPAILQETGWTQEDVEEMQEKIQESKEKIDERDQDFRVQILGSISGEKYISLSTSPSKQEQKIRITQTLNTLDEETKRDHINQRNMQASQTQPYKNLGPVKTFEEFLDHQTSLAKKEALSLVYNTAITDFHMKKIYTSLPDHEKKLPISSLDTKKNLNLKNIGNLEAEILQTYGESIGDGIFSISDENMPIVAMIACELAQAPLWWVGGGAYMAGYRIANQTLTTGAKIAGLSNKINKARVYARARRIHTKGTEGYKKIAQGYNTVKNSTRGGQKVFGALESTIAKLYRDGIPETIGFTAFQEVMSWIKDVQYDATSAENLEKTTLLLTSRIFFMSALPQSKDMKKLFEGIVKKCKLSSGKFDATTLNSELAQTLPATILAGETKASIMQKMLTSTGKSFDDTMTYGLSAILAKNTVAFTFDDPSTDINPLTLGRQVYLFKNLFGGYAKSDAFREKLIKNSITGIHFGKGGITIKRQPKESVNKI